MYIENVLQKLVLDPFLIFEIVLKQPILAGSFFETYFEIALSENFKKLTWFFPSHPVSFYGQDYEKQKGPGTNPLLVEASC